MPFELADLFAGASVPQNDGVSRARAGDDVAVGTDGAACGIAIKLADRFSGCQFHEERWFKLACLDYLPGFCFGSDRPLLPITSAHQDAPAGRSGSDLTVVVGIRS